MRRALRTGLLLSLCLLLCGCMNTSIKENEEQAVLPALDPEAGVAKDVTLTRYYGFTNEPYLLGVTRTIEVRANERTEYAIMRSLLEGVPPLANDVSAVIPEGTDLVDVSLDGGILYITLSSDFLDESSLNDARAELRGYLNKGYITQEQFDARDKQAEQAFYLQRRLAVYSIVNTMAGYSPDIRVLLLVDIDHNGSGERLSRRALGLEDVPETSSSLIEPMVFDATVVATPYAVMECLLKHLCAGEYALAYPLFADDDSDEQQKPIYANFETEMLSMPRLVSYSINGVSPDEEGGIVYANVKLDFRLADGSKKTIEHAQIPMRREGDLYKTGYASYCALVEVG